jgi:hypothetical protein
LIADDMKSVSALSCLSMNTFTIAELDHLLDQIGRLHTGTAAKALVDELHQACDKGTHALSLYMPADSHSFVGSMRRG